MKLTLFCAILGLMLLTPAIYGQPDYSSANNWENTMTEMILKENRSENDEFKPSVQTEYKRYKGSPFYNGEVLHGALISARGDKVEDIDLLYNILKNEWYYIKGAQEQLLIKPYIKEIQIQEKKKIKIFRRINPHNLDRFYEVLFEDDEITFFIDVHINKIEGVNKGMVEVAPKLTSSSKYMLINKNRNAVPQELNLKKRDMLKFVNRDRAKACREFLKSKNKYRLKSEESYIEMLTNTQVSEDSK